MSGISSSVGLISGINSAQIIDQLLSIEAQPENLIKQRVTQLQSEQAAFLALNSKLSALKTAAQKLRLNKIFDSATVVSSNSAVLTGTASPGAPAGNYSFLVDRTVSTHQVLSTGFVDRSTSGIGLTSLTFESAQARLDSDTDLGTLNGGAGISRGSIVVTNKAGTSTTIDLSRVASISEVLDAFNSNTTAKVTASVSGGKLVLTDTSGGAGSLTVRSATGYTTAASLGIDQSTAGGSITGSLVSYLGDNTTIRSLLDGNGIRLTAEVGVGGAAYDFKVTGRNGTQYSINLSDVYTTGTDGSFTKTASAVTTIAQLKARISAQTNGDITVQTTPDGAGIQLVDNTGGAGDITIDDHSGAAADLGFVASKGASATFTGVSTVNSRALLAGLQSRLTSTLRGGQGIPSGAISLTARDGSLFNLTLNASGSVSDFLQSISDGTGGKITGSLDSNGTSIILTDTTGGGGNLQVSGAAAVSLGILTPLGGIASSTITTPRIDRQYIAESTTLASLNGGRGVGTGTVNIIGADGGTKTVNIGTDVHTVGDLLRALNAGSGLGTIFKVNDAGNGITAVKDPAYAGADQKITITDTTGSVARSLNLAGTASGTGSSNYIDGSYRVSVGVSGTDTLDQIIQKVNSSNAGVTASVVTDGSSGAPYRLKLTSNFAGDQGRFQVAGAGVDLGLSTISAGQDSRVFYGAADPAKAILIRRPSNAIDGVIDGLSVDAVAPSTTPVSLTVSRDTDSTVTAIQDFVTAFNAVSTSLGDLTKYDPDTQQRGILLGDSTALSLNNDLFNTIQGSALGVGGQYRQLAQIGLKVSRDGTISVDTDKLNAALSANPQDVKEVFSAFEQTIPSQTQDIPGVPGAQVLNANTTPTYTKLGVLERISQLVDKYIDSTSGILTGHYNSIGDEITADNQRIADFDLRLADKRTLLQNQFAQLESTLASLKSQQSSLIGIAPLSTG